VSPGSLHQRPVDGQISRCAGERLNVDVNVLRSNRIVGKELGTAPLGQTLYKVNIVHALVKAPVGVAAVKGQLPGHVAQPLLRLAGHAQRRIPLGVNVLKD